MPLVFTAAILATAFIHPDFGSFDIQSLALGALPLALAAAAQAIVVISVSSRLTMRRASRAPKMAGGSVVALPDTLEKALKGIGNVDTVIEGHGDVNTWAGFRDYTLFNRALLDAAKAGMGQQSADEIAASLKQKFPVFTKEELLTDLEYGGTPLSRAVINVNVAFQELGKK